MSASAGLSLMPRLLNFHLKEILKLDAVNQAQRSVKQKTSYKHIVCGNDVA